MNSPSRQQSMLISIIAAMAEERVIGIDNTLPWKLPSDMQWFRACTMGKPIVMGRKTFESFGAKPLRGRTNVIVTRDKDYQAENCIVAHSIDEALRAVADEDEIMIIGGASFYEQMLPRAQRMYLTFVETKLDGDAWFPDYDETQWREVERTHVDADEKNGFAHDFVIFERV